MKGFLYIFEATLAGIIIISFLVFMNAFHKPDMSLAAYETLKGLDEQGLLRPYAERLDAPGLDSKIEYPGFSHSIEICGRANCTGRRPEKAGDVFSGSYIIAGAGYYSPAVVRLYLWK